MQNAPWLNGRSDPFAANVDEKIARKRLEAEQMRLLIGDRKGRSRKMAIWAEMFRALAIGLTSAGVAFAIWCPMRLIGVALIVAGILAYGVVSRNLWKRVEELDNEARAQEPKG